MNVSATQSLPEQPIVVPTADTTPPDVNRFIYDGKTSQIFGIWVLNIVLSILTLGIYTFWAKTRIRKYISASFSLDNDRFEYTGTGKELFLGFLKALPVLLLFYAPFIAFNPEQNPWVMIFAIPLIFLFVAAGYMALRYRLSRTVWRGIRGHLRGSALGYVGLYIKWFFLNILTLGVIIPKGDIAKHRYIVGHTHFGTRQAEFDGSHSGKLIKTHIITLLLAPFTLMLSRFWYKAEMMRHLYNHTTIGNMRFYCNVTAGNIIGLLLGNMFFLLITVGLGQAIIVQRNVRFMARHYGIRGDIAIFSTQQSEERLSNSGEALDGAFDLDTGFM